MGQSNKEICLIPAQVPTTVNLIWRASGGTAPAPANFQKVFGKRSLTLTQLRNIAEEWEKQNIKDVPEREEEWFKDCLAALEESEESDG